MQTSIPPVTVSNARTDLLWISGARRLRYGADYNPDQWPRETWLEDIELMKAAAINLVSVGIFSWVLLEPREGDYDFTFLDEILGLLASAGIDVDLATPTAAPPAWFWKKYPAARPVTREGVTLGSGSRGMLSPSSPEYRRAATAIAEQLAIRYANYPAVVMWHVHNEYGAPVGESYDDYSVAAFRLWLRERYGSLDALNDAWGTAFWGQRYQAWEEIDAPRVAATTSNQTQRLDFKRFSSNALLECFIAERDAIRRHCPDKPITTNFMATNCLTPDYWRWAREVDIVANDHYLVAERTDNHILLAMDADFTRSLAQSRPWILMEHSTSAVNWQPRNIAKRPGELARNSLSHLARGADAILFFQFRASQYGAEKFHSAMLPHAGTGTRIWREVTELGDALGRLTEICGSRVIAEVAIVWDTESFWAQDLEWRPSIDLNHRERIEAFYTALWTHGVAADFVHPAHDLSAYRLVVVPSLYLIDRQCATNLRQYVAKGGALLVSYFSGIVDENDAVYTGATPGALRDVLGLEIHEFLPLRENETVRLSDGSIGRVWADEVHLTSAKRIAGYETGPAAGLPAITRNDYEAGTAWYVSTRLDGYELNTLIIGILAERSIASPATKPGLEIVTRTGQEARYTFLINHSGTNLSFPLAGFDLLTGENFAGEVAIPAGKVRVIRHSHGPAL